MFVRAFSPCCAFFAIALVLFVGSMLLRASVAIANRWQGRSSKSKHEFVEEDLDEWIGYRKFKQPTQGKGIPEPGVLKGMLCVLVLSISGFLYGLIIWVIFLDSPQVLNRSSDEIARIVTHFVGLVLGFPFSAWLLAKLLPTRFGSACLALLVNYILLLMIVVLIFSCVAGF